MAGRRKRTSWEIQQAVVFALMMRELKTRFGSYRLGYLWALLEPLSHVAVFVIIFGVIMERTMAGISYPVFLITGIMPWLLFSNILNRGMVAVKSNAALFGYRQVKPMDTIVTRTILEVLIQLLVFAVILVGAVWIGHEIAIVDPFRVLAALGALVAFSFGTAICLCIAATLHPELSKLLPMLLRPLYFMSGIFWSLGSIPQEYHPYLTWNPLLHVIEEIRAGFFAGYSLSSDVSMGYVAILAVTVIALGMALYRQEKERLVAT